MALCPLLNKECIRETCAWWHGIEEIFVYESEEDFANRYDEEFEAWAYNQYYQLKHCTIARLPSLFGDIKLGLDEVKRSTDALYNSLEEGFEKIDNSLSDLEDQGERE